MRLGLTRPRELPKCPSGIHGLDEITGGGLPRGRPTLVCGGPGCGKTLLGMEFLVRGFVDHGEPGVFVSFEESEGELAKNVAGLGFDVPALVAKKKLAFECIPTEKNEIEESGDYGLDGLFLRLGLAFDAVGAKRVVLDTIESLFTGLTNGAILRAELRRLFRWLKERGVTTVVTGERGEGQLTRQGLEEYVSDCVILLDQRVVDQVSTRRIRIVKYRGAAHGTNEFPFLIGRNGFNVAPITGVHLTHEASTERVPSGVPHLDEMLGGAGYFRGSSVLVSGAAGSGKTSIAEHFADAACRRGDKCLYLAFEESPRQIVRNARSIGLDLERWTKAGRLAFHASRPTMLGLETHLATMHAEISAFGPDVVVVDPITNLAQAGSLEDATRMLQRLIDHLKARQITSMFTHLTRGESTEESGNHMSSLMDTWLLLKDIEGSGERNRVLYVLKSRGMAHSNQVREFHLSDEGIRLADVYLGPGGVLTGTARINQEALEADEEHARREEIGVKEKAVERKVAVIRAQMVALEAELASEAAELARVRDASEWCKKRATARRKQVSAMRSNGNGASRGRATNGRGHA